MLSNLSNGKSSVRRRVLVPLTLTFLVLAATFILSTYKMRTIGDEGELAHRYKGVQNLFDELLLQRVGLMTSAIDFLSKEESLVSVLMAGDRKELTRRSLPILKQLKNRYGITHFYFYNTDGTVFLRVHQPERFGDRVERFTAQRAFAEHITTNGLELGVLGTFTHRVVAPLIYQDKVIGFVELGEEIEQVVDKLKKITGTDFMVAIKKKFLERQHWALGMQMLGRLSDWDLLPEEAIVDYTFSDVNREELRTIHTAAHHGDSVEVFNKRFQLKNFPLMDAGQRIVGDFILMHDVTKVHSRIGRFALRILAIGLVACAGLFAFSFAALGRVDRALYKAKRQLLDQVNKAKQINSLLEIEVGERKSAEQQLTRLNENLEEMVADRTSELEAVNCDLGANQKALEKAYDDLKTKQATILHQDKMAGIGQLAAGVAHDINNPIGFVYNNLRSLEKYSNRMVTYIEKQADALQSCASKELLNGLQTTYDELKLDFILGDFNTLIEESIEGTARVSKIVKNLHTFSRIDDSECKLANILDCLESTLNIARNELMHKAVVKRDYGEIPDVYCCPQQLNQVFMNLLINSAQSIKERGEIIVKAWSNDESVFVSISDTGEGIPQEKIGRIFEPFYTTKDVGKGTGLGLSITYDIVKKHNGEISVDSEVGKGTTFTIRLPIEQDIQHG